METAYGLAIANPSKAHALGMLAIGGQDHWATHKKFINISFDCDVRDRQL